MGFLFRDADDFERMAASFIYSTANEIEKIFRFIPSRDLAIQWNIYFETLDINGLIKWSPNEIIIKTNSDTRQFLNISEVFYPDGWIVKNTTKNNWKFLS